MGKRQNSKCSQRRKNKKIKLENKNLEDYLSFLNSIDPQTVQGQTIIKLDNYDKTELKKELDKELDNIFSIEATFELINPESSESTSEKKESEKKEKGSFFSTLYSWFKFSS